MTLLCTSSRYAVFGNHDYGYGQTGVEAQIERHYTDLDDGLWAMTATNYSKVFSASGRVTRPVPGTNDTIREANNRGYHNMRNCSTNRDRNNTAMRNVSDFLRLGWDWLSDLNGGNAWCPSINDTRDGLLNNRSTTVENRYNESAEQGNDRYPTSTIGNRTGNSTNQVDSGERRVRLPE